MCLQSSEVKAEAETGRQREGTDGKVRFFYLTG